MYRNLLSKLPEGGKVMEEAYSTIEKILKEVSEYVTVWLQYQSLWDMQSHNVYDRLGGDLTKWMQLLTEIR